MDHRREQVPVGPGLCPSPLAQLGEQPVAAGEEGEKGLCPLAWGTGESPDPQRGSLPLPDTAGTWRGWAGWVRAGRGVGGVWEKVTMSRGGWMGGNSGRIQAGG